MLTEPDHGSVSNTTPTAASAGHSRRRPPRAVATATPSGPRNSSALAVPSGMRSIAAMNSMVMPAVTPPRATAVPNDRRVNAEGRGRTMTSSRAPAQTSLSQAAPSAPMRSISATEVARPNWTNSMAVIAIAVPDRTEFCGMEVFKPGGIVHVHVISPDITFTFYGQWRDGLPTAGAAGSTVPAGLDARRGRLPPPDDLDGLPAVGGAGPRDAHPVDRARGPQGATHAGRTAPGRPRGVDPGRSGRGAARSGPGIRSGGHPAGRRVRHRHSGFAVAGPGRAGAARRELGHDVEDLLDHLGVERAQGCRR